MDDPLLEENVDRDDISIQSDGSEIEESLNNINSWNINYEEEKKFWIKLDNDGYFYYPKICPICQNGNIIIKQYTNTDILNIYYGRCNNSKCRKIIRLRYYSILKLARNLLASVIFLIINLFFFEALNATKITDKLKIKFKDNINNTKKYKIY